MSKKLSEVEKLKKELQEANEALAQQKAMTQATKEKLIKAKEMSSVNNVDSRFSVMYNVIREEKSITLSDLLDKTKKKDIKNTSSTRLDRLASYAIDMLILTEEVTFDEKTETITYLK